MSIRIGHVGGSVNVEGNTLNGSSDAEIVCVNPETGEVLGRYASMSEWEASLDDRHLPESVQAMSAKDFANWTPDKQ